MKPLNTIRIKSTGEIIVDYKIENGRYTYTLDSGRKCNMCDLGSKGFQCSVKCNASETWTDMQFSYKYLYKEKYYSSQYIFLRNYDRKIVYRGEQLKYKIIIDSQNITDITFYYKKETCVGILCKSEDNKILRCCRHTKYKMECRECGKMEDRNVLIEEYVKSGIICLMCRSFNHNPFKGKKHKQEFKQRLSKERKGTWGVGEKNPMYGEKLKDHMTEEKYNEWKQKQDKLDFSGKNNPMYGKNIKDYMSEEKYNEWKYHQHIAIVSMSEEKKRIKSQKSSESQRKFREQNPEYYRKIKQKAALASMNSRERYQKTSIEEKVDKWLTENNINHTYPAILSGIKKTHQYDFIIHGRRILIEVNGDYWHGNPSMFNIDGSCGKRKLNESQLKNMQNDISKKELAEFHNFKILYIWEYQINNNDFSPLNELLQYNNQNK